MWPHGPILPPVRTPHPPPPVHAGPGPKATPPDSFSSHPTAMASIVSASVCHTALHLVLVPLLLLPPEPPSLLAPPLFLHPPARTRPPCCLRRERRRCYRARSSLSSASSSGTNPHSTPARSHAPASPPIPRPAAVTPASTASALQRPTGSAAVTLVGIASGALRPLPSLRAAISTTALERAAASCLDVVVHSSNAPQQVAPGAHDMTGRPVDFQVTGVPEGNDWCSPQHEGTTG